jgi:hypothetical protein
LEFQRVAAVGASVLERQESTLTLGNSNAAEESLIKAELVELPDGGVVLPLAHHQFLVGLLFLEEASAPSQSALSDLTRQTLGATGSLVRWGFLSLLNHGRWL